jgi:hypothetical protein
VRVLKKSMSSVINLNEAGRCPCLATPVAISPVGTPRRWLGTLATRAGAQMETLLMVSSGIILLAGARAPVVEGGKDDSGRLFFLS